MMSEFIWKLAPVAVDEEKIDAAADIWSSSCSLVCVIVCC